MYPNTVYPQPPLYNEAMLQPPPDPTTLPSPERSYPLPEVQPPPNYNSGLNYNYPSVPPLPDPYSIPESPPPAYANRNRTDEEGFTIRHTFKESHVRRDFIRKVYGILCIQLLITVGIVALFTFVDPLRMFIRERLYFVFLAALLVVIVYPLVAWSSFGKSMQRNHPDNIVLLIVLTLLLSLFIGVISSFVSTQAVIFAVAFCTGVCLLVAALSSFTRITIEGWCGAFIVVALLCFWLAVFTVFTYREVWYIQVVYGFIGAVIFGLFLAYDTNKLFDEDRFDFNPEDYIRACIKIYTDIVVLLFFILLLFCGSGGGQ